MHSKAIFLFDESAFPQQMISDRSFLQKLLSCLHVVCVRLLSELCNRSPECQFGFKFFDTLGSLNQKMDKHPMDEVNLDSFMSLERELRSRFEKCSYRFKVLRGQDSTFSADKFTHTIRESDCTPPVKILNKALTEILCDFEWKSLDMHSPVRRPRKCSKADENMNFVFLFSYCPVGSDRVTENYFKSDGTLSVAALQNHLMPLALYRKFVEEAGISLIWLDTADLLSGTSEVSPEEVKSQQIFHTAVNNLGGSVVPLQILVHAGAVTSQDVAPSITGAGNSVNITDNCCNNAFSLVFSCSVSNRYSNSCLLRKDCCLFFPCGGKLCTYLLFPSTNDQRHNKVMRSNKQNSHKAEKIAQELQHTVPQNFSVCGTISTKFYKVPCKTYLVHPSSDSSSYENSVIFMKLIKALCARDEYLALKSDDVNIQSMGILCPISAICAALAIYEPRACENGISSVIKPISLQKLLDWKGETSTNSSEDSTEAVDGNFPSTLTSSQEFASQMLSQKSQVSSDLKEHGSSDIFDSPVKEYQCLESFLKKLQHQSSSEKRRKDEASSPRRSPRLSTKRTCSSPTFSRDSKIRKHGHSSSISSCQPNSSPCAKIAGPTLSESECRDKEYVTNHLRELYNKCLESEKDILVTAQNIISNTLLFFRSTHSSCAKKDAHQYLEHRILKSAKKIQEEYEGQDCMSRKSREYQVQTLLNLELEAAFPSLCSSKCVETVTSLLRAMSFAVGPGELVQFLQECVKQNYSQRLRHVLTEVGDELNVPLVPEPFSPSSTSDFGSPDQRSQSSASPCSSLFASRSSSGMTSTLASQADGNSRKRSIVRHASFSENFQRRQIMVPKELLRKRKKEKPKTDPRLPRRSPRFLNRSQGHSYSDRQSRTRSVRRNLFNVEKKVVQSPKKSPNEKAMKRRRLFSSHQTGRRTLVPETPSPKQGKSALKRRQARIQQSVGACATVQEIAESPTALPKL